MSAGTPSYLQRRAAEQKTEHDLLSRGCERLLGIGVSPFVRHFIEFLWNVLVLGTVVYFYSSGVDPLPAMGFGALLIGGEKAFESYLIGIGAVDAENYPSRRSDAGED